MNDALHFPSTRGGSGTFRGGRPPFALAAIALSLVVVLPIAAHAAPAGGAVAAGGATIATTGTVTTITQTTSRTAINWQSFGIAAGESVNFVQPGSSSVALNRVLGPNPSAIFGNLSANGQVFLVNPNGVLFGNGASVNVGGLVASTLNIGDADFMAGRNSFSGSSRAAVTNQGTIHAPGGYVALLGADVANQGTITSSLGSVALAAGQALTLDLTGDKLLSVTVDQGAVNALARNGGLIQADGGQVLMTTQAAGNLLATVVNNTGVIRAQTLQNQHGSIRLLGDMQSGTVSIGGTLDVSGPGGGQAGGSVTATAHHVGLFAATIDASGQAGGGTVLVGGGWQGRDSTVPNASASYMSTDSRINGDATVRGDGGQVVLWGNDSTRAYGSITARGGAQGGDGGMVETSAHVLDVWGITVNASSPLGRRGSWLLDPADVTIGAGTTNGAFISNVFTPNSGVGAATVDAAALRTALEAGGGTDVTITTTNTGAPGGGEGNITVASAVTWAPVTQSTLTLNAAGDVNIDAAVTATRGNLVVCCGRDINVRAAITTTNGSTLLSAGRDVNILRTIANPLTGITATDGNILICAANDINLQNASNGAALITITNGSVTLGQSLANLGVPFGLTLSAGTGGTGPGVAGGTLNITPGTTLTVNDTQATVNYNPITYADAPPFAGAFTLTPAAALAQRMLVFGDGGDKLFDGNTATVLTGLKGNPAGVSLVAGPGSIANFDTAAIGVGKAVSYTGYTLAGPNAANFALATTCCGPIVSRTTGTIAPIAPIAPVASPGAVAPGVAPGAISAAATVPTVFAITSLLDDETLSQPARMLVSSTPPVPSMVMVVRQPEPVPVVAPQPAVAAPAVPARPPAAPAAPAARPAKPFRN